MDANLGSGGTHIDNALNSINSLITSVGDGSAVEQDAALRLPRHRRRPGSANQGHAQRRLVRQQPRHPLSDPGNSYPNICTTLKNRGIIVSVLYIPYQTISPVNASFAGDEDDYANNNIPNIPTSLSACASPADAGGTYFYTANTPADITGLAERDVQPLAANRPHHELRAGQERRQSVATLHDR